MNYHHHANYVSTRQQQLRAEAEHNRLVQEAQPHDETITTDDPRTPIYAPLLARAGETLVELGQQLQQRYGEFEPYGPKLRTTR